MVDARTHGDEQNLLLTDSPSVEAFIGAFYDAFPYPWKAWSLDRPLDPHLYRVHLSQDVGDWAHERLPASPRVWVAGCGTNQAAITALRFPLASVLGSDLSEVALELESEQAASLELQNVELRHESLTKVSYDEEFDYVVCTGVVHHNSDPSLALEKLRTSLKPHGLLELMVYNRFHRIATSSFQKAVRLLSDDAPTPDWRVDAALARRLVESFPLDNFLSGALRPYRSDPEGELVDAIANPVEHSFTVGSLTALAEAVGLQPVGPCPNKFDLADDRYLWDLEFDDPDVQERFDRLADVDRWQVVNLLRFERSPMLWFYFERSDSNRRRSQDEINDTFLSARFTRSDTRVTRFVRDLTIDEYAPLPDPVEVGPVPPSDEARRVLAEISAETTMVDALAALGMSRSPRAVNRLRLSLTSSLFPHLRAHSE
jgi:SAM-dependent methyltransferase